MGTLDESASRSRDDANAFMSVILEDSDSVAATAGAVACNPKYDASGHVLYEGINGHPPVVVSPVCMHKVWITTSSDRPSDPPVMRVVLSVPLSEFDNQDTITGASTPVASYVEAALGMFGPDGKVNQVLAENLPEMLGTSKKKIPIIAKVAKLGTAPERLKALSADCHLGFVSGAGTKSTFMNKQATKLWHHTKTNAEGVDETTSYVQHTWEVKKLFVPAAGTKSDEQQAAHLKMFPDGSDLWHWQMENPDMAPNLNAVRITCADPHPTKKETWVDLAYSMTDLTKPKEIWMQLHSCPWKTWMLADRKRIVHSHFVNEIDVYTVVKFDSSGSTRTLLNPKQRARADKRKAVGDNEFAAKLLRAADEGE